MIGQRHTGDAFNWLSAFGVDKRISSVGFFCVYKTRSGLGSIVGKVRNVRVLSQCPPQGREALSSQFVQNGVLQSDE